MNPYLDTGRAGSARRFPLTDMPAGLMLGLVALGLPRTVLADLGLVLPESSLLYYFLALAPFAAWLVVAVAGKSRRPFRDFLVLGTLYGFSLLLIHQLLWTAGPSLGHQPPQSAVDFAARFPAAWTDLALRVYTSGIALAIGIGTGLVAATIAWTIHKFRARENDGPRASLRR